MNKRKTIVLGLVLLLVIMPIVGMMMASPAETSILNNTPFSPIKDYGISADCVVDTTGTKVTNLDDTDNLYGGNYKSYTLIVNTSYTGTGLGIANITVEFVKTSTTYFSFKYLNSTNVVSEVTNPTYVVLGAHSNVTSGNYCNLTIAFTVEWAMIDIDDVDINVTVWNAVNSTESTKNADYDFDTELTMIPTSFINLMSTSVNDPIAIASTTISYEDSGGDNYPLAAQTDFLLVRTPSTGGVDSWSEVSYSDSTGIATWATVTAGYIAQKETFTMYAYKQGTTTTNLFYTSFTDSLELSNSGGAVYEPESTLLTPQNILLGGIVIVAIILIYKWKNQKSARVVKRKSNRSKSKGRKR